MNFYALIEPHLRNLWITQVCLGSSYILTNMNYILCRMGKPLSLMSSTLAYLVILLVKQPG